MRCSLPLCCGSSQMRIVGLGDVHLPRLHAHFSAVVSRVPSWRHGPPPMANPRRGMGRVPSGRCLTRNRLTVEASYRGSPGVRDRIVAAMPYMLPFLDAFSYGRYLFYQYPAIARAIAPVSPLVSAYASIPFAPLVCFFGIYLGIVNNRAWSDFVRFNALQAVLLDILLVLPRLFESLVTTPSSGWALQAYITSQNSIWLLIAGAVGYGMVFCLLGRWARIPFVAEAADQQLR